MVNDIDISDIKSRVQKELETILSYDKDGRRIKKRSYIRKQRLIHLANISMALNVLSDKNSIFDQTIVEEAKHIIRKEARRLWHI